MNKLAIIAIGALMIASAVVVIAQQAALATIDRDGGDRNNQEGKCRNCQQQQANNNEDSLNTESGDAEANDNDDNGGDVTARSGDANGGQFQNREGGG
jgi:hypothetical protein